MHTAHYAVRNRKFDERFALLRRFGFQYVNCSVEFPCGVIQPIAYLARTRLRQYVPVTSVRLMSNGEFRDMLARLLMTGRPGSFRKFSVAAKIFLNAA